MKTGLGMDDTAVSWFGSLLPFGSIGGRLVLVFVLKRVINFADALLAEL